MRFSAALLLVVLNLVTATPAPLEKRATLQGFDVSHYQPNVNFKAAYNSGARFVIIKVRDDVPLWDYVIVVGSKCSRSTIALVLHVKDLLSPANARK
jgi:hypothetical protein